MARMFLMCGRLAAGKSTFAKEFAEKNGFKYLFIDEFFKNYNGSAKNRKNKFRIWLNFYESIHWHEIYDYDVVIDVNAPNKYDRIEFLNWFPTYEHHLIEIEASKELCRENNKNRNRIIPEDYLNKINNNFESFGQDEFYLYDTRSKWISMSKVYNVNNHFTEFHTLLGKFPEGVKTI